MIDINKILFIDIETASIYPSIHAMPEIEYDFFYKKALYLAEKEDLTPAEIDSIYKNKAALFAEYSKVFTIGLGFIMNNEKARIKVISSHNEVKLLQEVNDMLNKFYEKNFWIAGHNIKNFTVPFISRRIIINDMVIPRMIQTNFKKSWDMNMIDTMEMWKFGEFKNNISLSQLAHLLGIGSKIDLKNDIHTIYHNQKDLKLINEYCCNDIKLTINAYLKITGQPKIAENNFDYLPTYI